MDSVRSFMAIELPDTLRSELARTQADIRKHVAAVARSDDTSQSIKWVDPAGIHLTLKFLGSVAAADLPNVEKAIQRAVRAAKPFTLVLSGLGVFPSWTRPRVIWVGVEEAGSRCLVPLQEAIEEELGGLGFARETRPFSPHLTLARLRETASAEARRAVGEAVRKTPPPRSMPFTVSEVSLMRSELSPHGARYSRLASFQL